MSIRRIAGQCAVLLVGSSVLPALSNPIIVQPRLGIGVQNYQISFEDLTSANDSGGISFRDGFKLGDSLPFVSGGITLTKGSFFLDLSSQWSQTGEDQTEIFQGTSGTTSSSVGHNHTLDAEFDREEFNATLGWAVTSNLSAYVGYKKATLDMTQARAPDLDIDPDPGDVIQLGDYIMEFTYDGFFAGATYSIPLRTWGALSIQTSLARLNGAFKQRFEGLVFIYNPSSPVILDPSFIDGSVHGDSLGFNIGISWTGHFNWISERLNGFSYTIGIDRSQYEFDSGASDTLGAADFEEKNTRGRLDLRYRFGGGE